MRFAPCELPRSPDFKSVDTVSRNETNAGNTVKNTVVSEAITNATPSEDHPTLASNRRGISTGVNRASSGTAAAGEVRFASLGVGDEVRRAVQSVPHLHWSALKSRLPRRDATAGRGSRA